MAALAACVSKASSVACGSKAAGTGITGDIVGGVADAVDCPLVRGSVVDTEVISRTDTNRPDQTSVKVLRPWNLIRGTNNWLGLYR